MIGQSVETRGFTVGRIVKDGGGNLSTIVSVEADGKVVLSGIGVGGESGEPETVGYEAFSANYQLSTSSVEIVNDWDKRRPSENRAYNDFLAKCIVTSGLHQLSQSAIGEESLRVHSKPTRSVTAAGSIGKGKLLTIPEAMKMSIIATGAPLPSGSLAVQLPAALGGRVAALLPHFSEKDFVAPAWAVKTTDDQDRANVEVVHKAVSVDISAGKGKKSNIALELPAMVNRRALAKDEELLVYREPPAKKPTLKRGLAHMALPEPAVKKR